MLNNIHKEKNNYFSNAFHLWNGGNVCGWKCRNERLR